MEMPVINKCTASTCAYNRQDSCHALAITVGDPGSAQCDTFFHTDMRGGDPSATGHVGACKMSDCQHNINLECQASGITVGFHHDLVDCLTYQPA